MKKYKLISSIIFALACSFSVHTQSLTTLFAGGNGFAGNTFDVTATNTITIDAFDVHLSNFGATGTIEIYYKVGTSVGFETTPNAWTLLGSTSVVSAGDGNPTHTPIGGLTIQAGETFGIYVNLASYPSHLMRYTNGSNIFSNADFSITTNTGQSSPAFSGIFRPRQWNGTIYYTLGGGAPIPKIEINDVSKAEGNWWGVTVFKFDLTRSEATDACSVDFATSDGTAMTSDNDYNPLNGTVTWSNGGSDVKSIWVTVRKDNKAEPDESFFVNLSNPVDCAIVDDTGEGTIINDDGAPVIGNDDPTQQSYVNSQLTEGEISIYPNPGRDIINVNIPSDFIEMGAVQVSLIDKAGKEIQTLNLNNNQNQIEISDLPQGVYNLVIQNAQGQKTTKKFLKIN